MARIVLAAVRSSGVVHRVLGIAADLCARAREPVVVTCAGHT